MNTKTLFSSATGVWETPPQLFAELNKRWNFTTDVCALPNNAKCAHYYTPKQNGLSKRWKGSCWMNPPYGKAISEWIAKAAKEVERGGVYCSSITTSPHRYKVVSRSHLPKAQSHLSERARKICWRKIRCAIPVNDCSVFKIRS